MPGARGTILIVDGDPAERARISGGLAEHERTFAGSLAEARTALAARAFDVTLVAHRLPDGSGLDLLRACQELHPRTRRLLITSYDEIPALVKERTSGLVERALQRSTRAENLARIVEETLAAAAASPSAGAAPPSGEDALDWSGMEQLLRWTAERIATIPGIVIRQHSPNAADMQLQFVLPAAQLEALRNDVVGRWRFPLKPKDGPVPAKHREHPVLEMLGDLSGDHEVYVRRAADGSDDTWLYLALLPWRRERRVTAALGIQRKGFREILRQLLLDVHSHAVMEVAEFPLPVIPSKSDSTGPGQTVLEYDWVVTDSYVGPDRRGRATSFLNRYMVIGRRRRVSSRLAGTTDSFVDRFARPVAFYALAYLLLSTVDTAFTGWFVRGGVVRELNPLLRPLVLHHAWAFVAVKYALSLGAFTLVARFQLFRLGRWLLGGTVAAYALLDLYWLVLLLARP